MTGALVFGVPAVLLGASVLVALLTVRLERTSGDRLRARRVEQPLAHEVPYWSFFDADGAGVAVNVDLTYSTVAELSGVDTDCLDDEALNQIALALHGVLQSLPPGALLQLHHLTDDKVDSLLERYRAETGRQGGIGQRLVGAKAEHLRTSRTLRRSRLLLALSLPNSAQKPAARSLGFVRRFPAFTPADHADCVRRLGTLRDQVVGALAAAGVATRVLGSHEIRVLAYQLLNPARAEVVGDPFTTAGPSPARRSWSTDQSAREQLALSGVEETRDRLLIDHQLVRVLTLRSLPTCTQPPQLEALLLGLPLFGRVVCAVEVLETVRALDDLKRRRDQAHVLSTLRERRNQEAEAQERDVEELIEQNLQSSIRMVRLGISVVLTVDGRTPDAEATLDRQTAEVLRLANSLHGAQLMVDELSQLDEFLATLPGNAAHGRRLRQCTSENAAHLLPVWQSWTGSGRPMVLVENGRHELVGLDPFNAELDNPNAFMAGSSGSGKSSTTNYLLLNLLAAGAKALIVDVGGSYRRIIELFGGRYFAVGGEGPAAQALNPFFEPADIVLPDGRLDDRRLQFLMAVVERMVCDGSRPELRNVERAVLAAALTETYRAVGDRTPLLSDLVAVLRTIGFDDAVDLQVARGLARELRIWTDGPAATLLNRPSTIELTSDVAAFDLKGLEAQPHLQGVVMVVLSGLIWNLVMRDPTEPKTVVFDEVWRLLETPASAQLVAELYRTSRKYRCSILTISQSVEDFTSSPIASALTNNSATVYLLRHRRGHEEVAAQFHLNRREQFVFQALEMRRGEFSEMLVLHGEHHFLARVVLSPLEYWIATTHPADLAAERALARRLPHLSRMELLAELAARHPQGAPARPETASQAA